MSLHLSNAPAIAANEVMISTVAVVEELSRSETEKAVRDYISRDEVKKTLAERGVTPTEVDQRLASLSDSELQLLAGNIHQERAGGILVTILIVVLIIFLIRRM